MKNNQRDTGQPWFKDAKYGMFIHWGLYAILAGEYQGKRTTNIAEWIMNDLDIPAAEYEKLAAEFNPIHFNADEYVRLAKKWGAKYLTFTAKHHDGFALYHSKVSPYNVVDASPYGKDIVAELAVACKKYGVKLCLYYSQAQDWHHPDGYRAYHDNSHKSFRRYLDEKCIPQIKELLTNYGEIGMMWFDTPMEMTADESKEVFDAVKSVQPNCIVSGRIGNHLGEYMTTSDNTIPSMPFHGDWEIPATLNNTWGYNQYDNNWKTPEEIITNLVKINMRGGNYLLNIGPMADGTIPAESVKIMDRVGEFLESNGAAIYGTTAVDMYPYEIQGKYFTTKPYHTYIHLLVPSKRFLFENVASTIESAKVLGDGTPVKFEMIYNCEGDSCWRFILPADYVFDPINTIIDVTMKEERLTFEPLI